MKLQDQFTQLLQKTMTMTAANTLTAERMVIGTPLMQQFALIIHWIEYKFARGSLQEIVAATDELTAGLARSGVLTTLSHEDPRVIDQISISCDINGVPASGQHRIQPLTKDFSNLPGGGILIPADQLYFVCASTGFAAAATVDIAVRYTIKELKPAEYIELIQTFNVTN